MIKRNEGQQAPNVRYGATTGKADRTKSFKVSPGYEPAKPAGGINR